MNRIEFESKTGSREVHKLMLRRLCSSRLIRLYYVLVVIVSVFVLFTRPDDYSRSSYENLGMLIVLALILPFVITHGLVRRAVKESKKEGVKVTFLDEEGYGQKGKTYEVYYKWERINSICETDKYILFTKDRWLRLVIYKYLLPDETVSSIRNLLATVPVEKKKLLQKKQDA